MNNRGQGSIEYLLIIGVVILVVGIVAVAILGLVSNNPAATTTTLDAVKCAQGCALLPVTSCGNIAAGVTPEGCADKTACVVDTAADPDVCKKA
jgi:hypothetical protein